MFLKLGASFSKIIIPYFSLILMIAIGILAARQRILTPERLNVLSEIVIVLILPLFAFWSAATGAVLSVLNQAPWMIGLGFCVGIAGYTLATVLARIGKWSWSRRSVLQVSGVSGNTGFLGIPICTAIFGSQGTILAILFDLGASFYLLTLGISAFQKTGQSGDTRRMQLKLFLQQFYSPIFIALVLGLGIALSGWQMPAVLLSPLESLANIAIPMMMLILGGLIYNTALNHRMDKPGLILLGLLKLAILPGLTWLVVSYLPMAQTSQGVAVIEAAMPSAIMAVTFATRYNADDNLASSATMLTTLISLLTVPIFAAAWK
jgi:malate permease and related proteins